MVLIVLIISFEAFGRVWDLKMNSTYDCRRMKSSEFSRIHPRSGGVCFSQSGIKKLPESERVIKIYLGKDEIYKIENGEKINYKILQQTTYNSINILDVKYPEKSVVPYFLFDQDFDCEDDNIIYFSFPGIRDPKAPPYQVTSQDLKKIDKEYFIECLRK
jgi:hypothetical protein